jgi:hypothetical protein
VVGYERRINMSGGSYNYAFVKIEDIAVEIRPTTPLRKAFKAHLRKVAKACRDIEWVDSGDCGPGDEDEAIRACLGKDGPALVLAEVLSEAVRVNAELDAAIDAANAPHQARRDSGVALNAVVGSSAGGGK